MKVYLKRVKSGGDCHTINTDKPCYFLDKYGICSQKNNLKYPCADFKRGVFVYIEVEKDILPNIICC